MPKMLDDANTEALRQALFAAGQTEAHVYVLATQWAHSYRLFCANGQTAGHISDITYRAGRVCRWPIRDRRNFWTVKLNPGGGVAQHIGECLSEELGWRVHGDTL